MSASQNLDVLIVGGGPAGSSCAWKLRGAGLNVAVWDRRVFPRDKICAGWITPQVLAALDLDTTDYTAGGRTLQPIRGFAVSRLGDPEARVLYERPVSYGIRRCEFDDYLLRRAGAGLRLGEPVRSLARIDGAWLVNDTVRAQVIVGAGGHFCPVARQLGALLGSGEAIVAAQESEFELTPEQRRACTVEQDVPEIFFTRDLKGYGWVFRKGRYANIGLGRQDSKKLGDHVSEFLAFLVKQGKIPSTLPAKFHGHPYLLYGQAPRPLLGDGVLLIGDAAGLAYPRSGEGIRPAIESGMMAAETILEADGRYERERLAVYERRIIDRFGPRQAGRGVMDFLPEWVISRIAASLFGSVRFARHVVLERWFFHMHQAPLHHDETASALRPVTGPSHS
jgi:geranylgeranyl reductase family protein